MRVQAEKIALEEEIDTWLENNFRDFWPDAIYIPGFLIKTLQGKGGKPDGFIFDPVNRQWFVIENELIRHGVWNHIAEQLIRFVVAINNPESLNKVRDRLFEEIEGDDRKMKWALRVFETKPLRLLKAIENFLEYPPKLLVFIDEVNSDMTQLVSALAIDVEVYRLMKIKDDKQRSSIFSPDLNENKPAISHVAETRSTAKAQLMANVIEKSNLEKAGNKRGFKWYKMPNGDVIHLKYSKYYERNKSYWYGITPESLNYADEYGISHFGFIIGEEGCVIVGLDVMKEFVKNAKTSPNPDGTVRHYHFFVSPGPQPNPFHYNSEQVFECAFVPSD